MLEYPAMAEDHRHRFAAVINDEATALSARLTQTLSEHADTLKAQRPLEDMSGADLLSAIRRRLESELGVAARADEAVAADLEAVRERLYCVRDCSRPAFALA